MSGKAPKSEGGQPAAHKNEPPASHAAHTAAHGHLQLLPSGFLDKLKRRNVGRVAILYIVVCYLILEPFEMFFHLLDLPVWTGRTAVALMVLGFPVALLLAWIYEITPEGIKPSAEVDPQQSIARQTGRKLDRAIIAVLAVALIYFVADKFFISKHQATEKPAVVAAPAPSAVAPDLPVISEKSVAVLPFVDLSEKHDQEYFADGLAEELLDRLARIPGLHVSARTSSFYFRGKSIPISEIGRDLRAAYLVEGSVRKDRNIVRTTAQLIRADTGNHVWSVTYERPMQDVFKTQQTIAIAIADALKVTVDNRVDYGGHQTTSPEAFDLYLQAVDNTHKDDSAADLKVRLEKAKQAVAIDPSFSDGWSAVALLSTHLALNSDDKTGQLARQARNALDRATKAGNTSARILIRAAFAYLTFDRSARNAMLAYQRAIALDPDGVQGLAAKIFSSFIQGDTARALVAARRANELDPYAAATNNNLAQALAFDGQWADALAAAKRALELYPESEGGVGVLALILIQNGDPKAALETVNKIDKSPEIRAAVLPFVYDALNRKTDADAALADLIKQYGDRQPYDVAIIYAHRHDADQAFVWLDRAYSGHDHVWYIRSDPFFEPIRSDPRYAPLLEKWGLVD
jgi:adenylate cyclase